MIEKLDWLEQAHRLVMNMRKGTKSKGEGTAPDSPP
jgi:hypothetical protein